MADVYNQQSPIQLYKLQYAASEEVYEIQLKALKFMKLLYCS